MTLATGCEAWVVRLALQTLSERGVSLAQVARRTGLSTGHLERIRAGRTKRCSTDTQHKVATLLPKEGA